MYPPGSPKSVEEGLWILGCAFLDEPCVREMLAAECRRDLAAWGLGALEVRG